MNIREPSAALSLGMAAILCGLTIAPRPALGDFVVNDRAVSDSSVSLGNPAFDQINNLLVWQENTYNVWLAKLDPITGNLSPPNGKGKLIDTKAASLESTGNTAMFAHGDGLSKVIFSRNLNGILGLGEAAQDASQVWSLLPTTNPLGRFKPEGTHANWVGPAKTAYNFVVDRKPLVGWREVGNANSEGTVGGVGNLGGARWVEGENSLLVMTTAGGIDQLATIDLNAASPAPVQVTFEPENTFNAYSWLAPEFNGPAFTAMIGNQKLGIFRKTGNGAWEKAHEFTIPSSYKYFSSPEPFVWNGKSYVFFVAMSEAGAGRFPFQPSAPSEVWIAGIDPAQPFFRRVDDPKRSMIKAEPEVFVTASGPQIFYNERAFSGANWVVRAADTGLGTDWAYDSQAYSGPWAAQFRDNKNCSCTPFPVGEGYQEMTLFPSATNVQYTRQIMGPEGNLYAPVSVGTTSSVLGYDPSTAARVFRVNAVDVGNSLIGNGLIASNGDVFVAGNTVLARHSSDAAKLWGTSIRGAPTALQFAPDGNVISFSFNGWFQVFSPSDGQLLNEQSLTSGRSFPASPDCLNGMCAFPGSPAVDVRGSRIYVNYAVGNGASTVRAYAYDSQTRGLSLLWETAPVTGSISSPVLAADYKRVYAQSSDGKLQALDASTGAVIWSFSLGITTQATPVVSEFGYIVAGMRQSDDANANYVGIIKDHGSSADWAFKTTDFAAASLAAVGRGNRFALIANRASDKAPMLLVINPKFGVTSQTQLTLSPLPTRLSGLIIDEYGWIYAGTSGSSVYRVFSPTYETAVR